MEFKTCDSVTCRNNTKGICCNTSPECILKVRELAESILKVRKLAPVTSLYDSNSRDIVTTLRKLADAIECGQHGDVSDVALVLKGDRVTTFHFGAGSIERAHMLLACGQRNLEELYRM